MGRGGRAKQMREAMSHSRARCEICCVRLSSAPDSLAPAGINLGGSTQTKRGREIHQVE